MKRRLAMALVAAALVTTAAVTAAVVTQAQAPADALTASPHWRGISDDVGMLLREDDHFGLRARLYVKVNGQWRPVATDGAAELLHTIPLK